MVDDDLDPSPFSPDCPTGLEEACDTHGTAVAGITSASADNGVGIVGLCPACSLIPIRLLGDGAPLSAEITAFEHAIEQDAAVINNSWGYNEAVPASDALIEVDRPRHARAARRPRGGGGVRRWQRRPEARSQRDGGAAGGAVRLGARPLRHPDRLHELRQVGRRGGPVRDGDARPRRRDDRDRSAAPRPPPRSRAAGGWIRSFDPELSAAEVIELMVDNAHPLEPGHLRRRRPPRHLRLRGELNPPAIFGALVGGGDPPPGSGEEPRGCGCAGTPVAPWGGLAGLGLLFVRRRK